MTIKTFITLFSFLAFLAFISSIAPEEYRFVTLIDLGWLMGSFVAVAGACAVATGLPCAGALGVFSFISLFQYIVVTNDIVKTLLFTPIVMLIMYFAIRIARGGG